MRNAIVFSEPNVYAGWPANHGAWQWGNELAVGFITGAYQPRGMHSVAFPLHKRIARSLDGGETWNTPADSFAFKPRVNNTTDGVIDWAHPDLALRFCGDYDHGGDSTRKGGFYQSYDRGHTWTGPFRVQGPWDDNTKIMCTARTNYLQARRMVFLAAGHKDTWGADRAFVAVWEKDRFEFKGWIDDAGVHRCVMPAVAEAHDMLFAACRRKDGKRCWIELYGSRTGDAWVPLCEVAETGYHNGNPPALCSLADGDLCLIYGQRTHAVMIAHRIHAGKPGPAVLIRGDDYQDATGDHHDIGYPQVFQRPDGKVVAVYYWATAERPHQHIAATIFDPGVL